MQELILGGARSGKSRLAEARATASGKERVYIATAAAGDEAMARRIALHQQQRDGQWTLVEEPLFLADCLREHAASDRCLLVDCLTLWVSNLLLHKDPQIWVEQKRKLLQQLPGLPGDIVLVSNEVGQGIVPLGEINRRFVDETGFLHQELAQQVDSLTFVIAGIAQKLK